MSGTSERQIVHIINPVSGSGRKFKKTMKALSGIGESVYLTKRESDCEEFVAELLAKDPYAHVVAHGGDGTMNEAVNGIMTAGAGATALFTGIAAGNGNDLLRYMDEEKNEEGTEYPLDLIEVNGRYSVNIVNVGFDCTVVSEAEKISRAPGIGNSFSYILGVVSALTKKEAFSTDVVFRDVKKGSETLPEETLSGDYLLAAVANCRYYGGGFKAAPIAECDDGFLDVILFNYVTLPKFAKLVSDFRKGEHIGENGIINEKFKGILTFRRCRGVELGGIKKICCDGEITDSEKLGANALKHALIYTPAKKEWSV